MLGAAGRLGRQEDGPRRGHDVDDPDDGFLGHIGVLHATHAEQRSGNERCGQADHVARLRRRDAGQRAQVIGQA